MIPLIIVILCLAIAVMVVFNIHITQRVKSYKNLEEKVNKLRVLQDFLKVAGEEETVDEQLNKINEVIIEKYNIKYSTIVVFDGAEYVIKATNVYKVHYETLTNLHTEEIFQDSVQTATPKYVTIDNEN